MRREEATTQSEQAKKAKGSLSAMSAVSAYISIILFIGETKPTSCERGTVEEESQRMMIGLIVSMKRSEEKGSVCASSPCRLSALTHYSPLHWRNKTHTEPAREVNERERERMMIRMIRMIVLMKRRSGRTVRKAQKEKEKESVSVSVFFFFSLHSVVLLFPFLSFLLGILFFVSSHRRAHHLRNDECPIGSLLSFLLRLFLFSLSFCLPFLSSVYFLPASFLLFLCPFLSAFPVGIFFFVSSHRFAFSLRNDERFTGSLLSFLHVC